VRSIDASEATDCTESAGKAAIDSLRDLAFSIMTHNSLITTLVSQIYAARYLSFDDVRLYDIIEMFSTAMAGDLQVGSGHQG